MSDFTISGKIGKIFNSCDQADKFHGRNVTPVNKYPLAGVPMVRKSQMSV